MTLCKRLFSLLFSLLLLFPVFSLVASAEAVELEYPYFILQKNTLISNDKTNVLGYRSFIPHNGSTESDFINLTDSFTLSETRDLIHLTQFTYNFYDNDDSDGKETHIMMLKANTSYKVTMKNIYHSLFFEYEGYQYYIRKPQVNNLAVVYEDNTTEYLTDYEISNTAGTPYVDVSFKITPEKDVEFIAVELASNAIDSLPAHVWSLPEGYPFFTSYFGEYGQGDTKNLFQLEIETEEVGLLKTLLEWVKGIYSNVEDTYTSITSGFSSVVLKLTNGFQNLWDKLHDGFDNVVTSLIALPKLLWEKISAGLISLFVPSEEDMATYSNKWDELLAQRFGALYEAGDVVDSVVGSITNTPSTVAAEGKITIPQVSLDKFGIPFTFGGYEVDIRPQGFDSIITICKRAISIICTLAFVNALRKRYESVMGG